MCGLKIQFAPLHRVIWMTTRTTDIWTSTVRKVILDNRTMPPEWPQMPSTATAKVIADRGYQGEDCIETPGTGCLIQIQEQTIIRARHENVNSRLHEFAVMRNKFRQKLSFHNKCFNAVVNIVQFGPAGCYSKCTLLRTTCKWGGPYRLSVQLYMYCNVLMYI